MTTVVINSVDLGSWGFADPGEIPEGKNRTSKKETNRLSERGSVCSANQILYFSWLAGYVCFPGAVMHLQEYAKSHTR